MSPLISSWADHLIYGAAWLSFGAGHSLLAGERLTHWCGKYTRLIYNLLAVFHIAVVLAVGGAVLDRTEPLLSDGFWSQALIGLEVVGLIIFLVSLREYDLGLLSGFKQIRLGDAVGLDEDKLHLKGLHRYVRHPIYSGAFLLLWGGSTYEIEVATACWGSLYLLIGTYFEERRLIRLYGSTYEKYRMLVPAYFPWKGALKVEGFHDR